MADDEENDDQWLYGDAPDLHTTDGEKAAEENPQEATDEPRDEAPPQEDNSEKDTENENQEESEVQQPPEGDEEGQLPPPEIEDNGLPGEEEQEQQNGEGSDKDDSEDDSDDDVNVVIGNIKTSQAYTSLNIKRGGLLTSTVTDKSKLPQQQSGKFTVEEFEQMGTINWVPATDYNLDNMEDKPWRKPGADITDYFNYGFNEDTWKAYCERQKRLRVNESGVGLVPLNAIGLPRGPVPIMNDNSKYSGGFTGGAAQPGSKMDAPKENVIQVMTADRREYSRKPPGFPDLTMPPPSTFEEFQPEFGFNPEPEPFYGGYEPTQDIQWAGSTMVPPAVPPVNLGPPMVPPPITSPPHRRTSRDRERESRSRSEKSRDRERERSHRRERSRSRSRRHKSRSRSPSHRHRKKKSRRHEDSD